MVVGIAFPTFEHCITWDDIQKWVELSSADFMERYAREVLARYKLPSVDQMHDLRRMKLLSDAEMKSIVTILSYITP